MRIYFFEVKKELLLLFLLIYFCFNSVWSTFWKKFMCHHLAITSLTKLYATSQKVITLKKNFRTILNIFVLKPISSYTHIFLLSACNPLTYWTKFVLRINLSPPDHYHALSSHSLSHHQICIKIYVFHTLRVI